MMMMARSQETEAPRPRVGDPVWVLKHGRVGVVQALEVPITLVVAFYPRGKIFVLPSGCLLLDRHPTGYPGWLYARPVHPFVC